MRDVGRVGRWRHIGSLAAVPLLLVTVAACGGNNVGAGTTSTEALPSSTSTTPPTTTSTTEPGPSTSMTPPTATSSTSSTGTSLDWADPEAVGLNFFEAWRTGDESRMLLLVSDERVLDSGFVDVRPPDETVECGNQPDPETIQCEVIVDATGELYFALLRQDEVSGEWRVDWFAVSNVNEGGG
jgi:hypothetical protein